METIIGAKYTYDDVETAESMLKNFDEIKELKTKDPTDFKRKCFIIMSNYDDTFDLDSFKVEESKHGKGFFVSAVWYDEKRYWPSTFTYGDEHYPSKYLTKEEAENKLLNVLEELCADIYNHESDRWKLESKKED